LSNDNMSLKNLWTRYGIAHSVITNPSVIGNITSAISFGSHFFRHELVLTDRVVKKFIVLKFCVSSLITSLFCY